MIDAYFKASYIHSTRRCKSQVSMIVTNLDPWQGYDVIYVEDIAATSSPSLWVSLISTSTSSFIINYIFTHSATQMVEYNIGGMSLSLSCAGINTDRMCLMHIWNRWWMAREQHYYYTCAFKILSWPWGVDENQRAQGEIWNSSNF